MPGLDNYKEIFGVSPEEDPTLSAAGNTDPAEDGKQEQEPAAPAAETGEKKQEVTDPAPEGVDGAAAGEGAKAPDSAQDPEGQAGKTPEERHQQAQQRREREEAARHRAEQARIDKVYADLFAGQTDPHTGKPILSEADFNAYQQAQQRKQQEEQLTAAGIKPEVIEQLVDSRVSQHPLVLQAQQALEEAAKQSARAVETQAQEAIGAELKKITAMDSTVKSLDDIAGLPTAPQFNAYVQKGLSLEEAFYLANRQSIEGKRQAAAQQAAINQAKGKDHLNPAGEAGTGDVAIPTDVAAAYRQMNPNVTPEQMQQEYLKFLKDIGKK